MQDAWTEKYGTFPGWNCRITACGLFGDFITVTGEADFDAAEDTLFMDYETLDTDPESLCGDNRQKFDALFAPVKTTNTTDIPTHLKTIQQEWKRRGLSFVEDDKIRLISVVLHDQFSETDNSLMIGHVGVMLPTSDAVYFVEKVAFQEPYRLLKFKNRTELSDYLMLKYDNSWGQDTAHTFIMDNANLMDGWRILEEPTASNGIMKTKGAVAQRKSATAPRFVLLVSINTNLLQHFLRSHIGEQLTAVQAERGPIQSFVLHPAKLYPALFAKLHPALYQRQGRGGRAGSNKLGRQPLLCHNGCLMTVSAKDPINRMILQEPNQAVRSGKVVGIGFRCSRSVYRVVQREDRWAVCRVCTAPAPTTQVGCRTWPMTGRRRNPVRSI